MAPTAVGSLARRNPGGSVDPEDFASSGRPPVFLSYAVISPGVKSVRKGLRDGDITKDTYERLTCAECDQSLKTTNDPDELFSVRVCPDCGREWKDLR